MKAIDLSVVILNYNTSDILADCLGSIYKHTKGVGFEVVVVDNGSSDGSVEMVRGMQPKKSNLKLVVNKKNLGFAAGNNRACEVVGGEYVLFLNSDTKLTENTFKKALDYIKKRSEIGALTVKQVLPNGEMDKDSRRSFPTPWVALTHFSGVDRLFPNSKWLARYWYGYLSENKTSEIEVLQGAFFLSPKKVLDEIGWFDDDYFLNGEDIDLSWKIKKAGYKNVYYPKTSIVHLKGASKGKKVSKRKRSVRDRVRYARAGVEAMEIFYKKRMASEYSPLVTWAVLVGLRLMMVFRVCLEILR